VAVFQFDTHESGLLTPLDGNLPFAAFDLSGLPFDSRRPTRTSSGLIVPSMLEIEELNGIMGQKLVYLTLAAKDNEEMVEQIVASLRWAQARIQSPSGVQAIAGRCTGTRADDDTVEVALKAFQQWGEATTTNMDDELAALLAEEA
jgi:hypothetical protein